MARKTSSVPTKVYTYGAQACSAEQMKLVNEQVFQGFLYQKRLVQLENERRNRFRNLRCILNPELKALELEDEEIFKEISGLRAQLKEKKLRTTPEQEEVTQQIDELRKRRKALRKHIGEVRAVVDEAYFKAADATWKKLKETAQKAYEEKLGHKIGPRDPANEEVYIATKEAMSQGAWHRAWYVKLRINACYSSKVKRARHKCACMPGVYMDIEKAVKAASKDSPYRLKTPQFEHRGKVGIQLTGKDKGATVQDVLSGRSPKLKIEILDTPVHKGGYNAISINKARTFDRHARERALREQLFASGKAQPPFRKAAIARIRLEGRSEKTYKYIDVPFVMHRPLPEDGVIKWAYLYVKRIGYVPKYQIQFTLESKEFTTKESKLTNVIAVVPGWRRLDNGNVLVATTWDGEKTGTLEIPCKAYDERLFVTRLLSYGDVHFEHVTDKLAGWIREGKLDPEVMLTLIKRVVPGHIKARMATMKEALSSFTKWRSHERLHKLARLMTETYLKEGDTEILWKAWKTTVIGEKLSDYQKAQRTKDSPKTPKECRHDDLFSTLDNLIPWFQEQGIEDPHKLMALYLAWWRKKDEHLINWARNLDERLRLYKQNTYRVFANRLSQDYGQIILKSWDKSKTAENPEPEDDDQTPQEENANVIRQFAGVSVLDGAIKSKLGFRCITIEANTIPRVHHGCGSQVKGPKITSTVRDFCAKGHGFDQYENQARLLWDMGQEKSVAAE